MNCGALNSKTLFQREHCSAGFKVQDEDRAHTEVQEQCKQHMPTKGATQHFTVVEQKNRGGWGWGVGLRDPR